MSTSSHAADSPYRRDNYSASPASTAAPQGQDEKPPLDRNRIAAHRLLRDSATMLCGAQLRDPPYAASISPTLDAHEVSEVCGLLWDGPGIEGERDAMALNRRNGPMELSDPEFRPPTDSVAE